MRTITPLTPKTPPYFRNLRMLLWSETKSVGQCATGWTGVLVKYDVSSTGVVAQAALCCIEMSKHLVVTREVIPMLAVAPHRIACAAEVLLVVMREREGHVALCLDA